MGSEVAVAFIIGLLVGAVPLAAVVFSQSSEFNRFKDEVSTFCGVNLRTDKKVYNLGETINITLENRLDQSVFISSMRAFDAEKWNELNGSWFSVYSYTLPQYLNQHYWCMQGIPVVTPVLSRTFFSTNWNQTMIYVNCGVEPPVATYQQVSDGLYRLTMIVEFRYATIEYFMPEEMIIVHSNEFTILP